MSEQRNRQLQCRGRAKRQFEHPELVADLNGEKAAAGSSRPKKAGLFPQDMSACVEDILKGRLFAEIPPPSLKMGKVRVTVGTGAGNYPVQAPHHTWTSDQ